MNLRQKQRATSAKTERLCPRCGTPIRLGDMILYDAIAKTWTHLSCVGRARSEEQRAEAATREKTHLEWKD